MELLLHALVSSLHLPRIWYVHLIVGKMRLLKVEENTIYFVDACLMGVGTSYMYVVR